MTIPSPAWSPSGVSGGVALADNSPVRRLAMANFRPLRMAEMACASHRFQPKQTCGYYGWIQNMIFLPGLLRGFAPEYDWNVIYTICVCVCVMGMFDGNIMR